MERTGRLILAVTMTSVMVFMVTFVATWLNLGPRSDFLFHWVKAYLVAWPIAAGTAYVVMPTARRITDQIVAFIERKL
jgi:hypothetical protein